MNWFAKLSLFRKKETEKKRREGGAQHVQKVNKGLLGKHFTKALVLRKIFQNISSFFKIKPESHIFFTLTHQRSVVLVPQITYTIG
jgi:hypothetical protein